MRHGGLCRSSTPEGGFAKGAPLPARVGTSSAGRGFISSAPTTAMFCSQQSHDVSSHRFPRIIRKIFFRRLICIFSLLLFFFAAQPWPAHCRIPPVLE